MHMAVTVDRTAGDTTIRPFTVEIPESALDDLRARIADQQTTIERRNREFTESDDAEVAMCMLRTFDADGEHDTRCTYDTVIPDHLDGRAFTWRALGPELFRLRFASCNKVYERSFLLERGLRFGEDRRVSGATGCNTLGGAYERTGEQLRFGDLFSTKMACVEENRMTQETRFMRVLDDVDRFAITGDTLTLFRAGSPAARFVRGE
jgi:hypothetical protein